MKLLISLLPICLVYSIQSFFPIKQSFIPIFQPPSWVFAIVWPYLLLSFGIVSSLIIKNIFFISSDIVFIEFLVDIKLLSIISI